MRAKNEKRSRIDAFGDTIDKIMLRVMIRGLTILPNQFPKEGILNYSDYKGVEHSLLQIPVCNTKDSFFR